METLSVPQAAKQFGLSKQQGWSFPRFMSLLTCLILSSFFLIFGIVILFYNQKSCVPFLYWKDVLLTCGLIGPFLYFIFQEWLRHSRAYPITLAWLIAMPGISFAGGEVLPLDMLLSGTKYCVSGITDTQCCAYLIRGEFFFILLGLIGAFLWWNKRAKRKWALAQTS